MFDRPDHDRANEWVIEALSSENHIMEGKITEDQERIAALELQLAACQAERDRYYTQLRRFDSPSMPEYVRIAARRALEGM